MSTLTFLFARKLSYVTRYLLLVTGYDARKRDFSERVYGLYVLLLVAGLGLAVLGYAVTIISAVLKFGNLPADALYRPAFLLLGLWLASSPWRAPRAYDLYRFSLSDLDFLSNAPIPPTLVSMAWFAKSLFNRVSAILVLAFAILGSSWAAAMGANNVLGLIAGAFAAVAFYIITTALLWIMGLLRYREHSAYRPLLSYALALVIALVTIGALVFPPAQYIIWPAWSAADLFVGDALGDSGALLGLMGMLLVTAILGVVGVYIAARRSLLAPAFEEGILGGQLRRSVGSVGMSGMDDPRVQVNLARKLAQGHNIATTQPVKASVLTGPVGALLYKQGLRLSRMSRWQAFVSVSSLLGLGAVLALGVAQFSIQRLPFEVSGLAVTVGNFWLIRFGIATLRGDLSHIDFFTGWPLSRGALMAYDTALGFGMPLLSGELVLLLAGVLGVGWGVLWLWLLIWPLLVAVTALAAALELTYLLRKWPATPDTLPDLGLASLLVAGLVWLSAVLLV